jgi:hypothetical protein
VIDRTNPDEFPIPLNRTTTMEMTSDLPEGTTVLRVAGIDLLRLDTIGLAMLVATADHALDLHAAHRATPTSAPQAVQGNRTRSITTGNDSPRDSPPVAEPPPS